MIIFLYYSFDGKQDGAGGDAKSGEEKSPQSTSHHGAGKN